MRQLTADEWINLWERGMHAPSARRALLMLQAAGLDEQPLDAARLSIGDRDRKLLAWRELLLGAELAGLARCMMCGTQVEMTFCKDQISSDQVQTDSLRVEAHGYQVEFRLPNTEDLLAVVTGDFESARRQILAMCIIEARYGRELCSAAELPADVVDDINDRMSAADPQADISLNVTCPECGSTFSVAFDIVGFLWREIEANAQRLLREVHTFARAYGWSEAEVLALTSERRQLYLEMIDG